jgi:hypothetical protein
MYNAINSKTLRRAGEFKLTDVTLVSYQQGIDEKPKRVDIKSQVLELNIYESIFAKGLVGSLVIFDAQNIPNHLPLTGFEQLELVFGTPGTSRVYDFSAETGHPMHIYKISDRKGANPRSQMYVLHFCSKEVMFNEQIKVDSTYTDTIDNMVTSVFKDHLNSKKTLFVESTKNIRKYILPKMRPFQAIEMLANDAESARFNNAGMYFYETAMGYHLRSLENMLAITDQVARPVVAKYSMKPKGVKQGTGNSNILYEMQNASDFTILSQFDSLKNVRNGVYNSKNIFHDAFNKTFGEFDFDYHTQYEKNFHTEHDGSGSKQDNKSMLPLYRYKPNKFFSDFANANINMFSETSKIHTGIEYPEYTKLISKRLSQRLAFTSMKLGLTVPGFTGLSVGDLVAFEMPAYEPVGIDNPLDHDPYMSGRYLVATIRHKISTATDNHTMNIELMKDSVRVAYPEETNDLLSNRENQDDLLVKQYDLDDTVVEQNNETDGNSDVFTGA